MRMPTIGIVMNKAIITTNMPNSTKVLFLGKDINRKPVRNSRDSVPTLNA